MIKITTRRKTQEEITEEVKNLVGNEYTFLEEYKNNHTKMEVLHNKCGRTYKVRYKDFKRGNRCPECFLEKQRRSPEEFEQDFYKIMGDEYQLISSYTHSKEPITFKHKICGKKSTVKHADNMYSANMGCLKCTNKGFTKTQEDFVNQVNEIYGDGYEVIGTYVNNKTPIPIRHAVCGKISEVAPHNLLRKRGSNSCRHCSQSVGERAIKQILIDLDVVFEEEKTFTNLRSSKNYPYRYDFYVEKYNLVIEYHGRQHYISIEFFGGEEYLKTQKESDEVKKKYALDNNMDYLEIPYTTPLRDIRSIIEDKIELITSVT